MKVKTHEELKHGLKVKCRIDGSKINNARISIIDTNNKKRYFICQDSKDGLPCKDMFGFAFSWFIYDTTEDYSENYLKSMEIEIIKENDWDE